MRLFAKNRDIQPELSLKKKDKFQEALNAWKKKLKYRIFSIKYY